MTNPYLNTLLSPEADEWVYNRPSVCQTCENWFWCKGDLRAEEAWCDEKESDGR